MGLLKPAAVLANNNLICSKYGKSQDSHIWLNGVEWSETPSFFMESGQFLVEDLLN